MTFSAIPSSPSDSPPTPALVAKSIDDALISVDAELATRTWFLVDPERRKALSRAREFLQKIRQSLPEQVPSTLLASTSGLVQRTGRPRARYGRENAWDLAEALRACSYAFASDETLHALLMKESADKTGINYKTVFGETFPPMLLDGTASRTDKLAVLLRLHDERVDAVRHDRARDKLWQHFVWKLIPIVLVLLGACIFLDLTGKLPGLLPPLAGALGSVLSAVLKLRDSDQRIKNLRRSASFLLLQPMIGATAAIVMTWLGVANVLSVSAGSANLLLGFLAGFSEPFFLGTVSRLTDLAAASGKPADVPSAKVAAA